MSDAADAAVDEVLDESAVEGVVVGDEMVAAASDNTVIACTAEEAKSLVERARAAISELHTTMTEIIRRRAWEPLGYDEPRSFWIAEFGPSSENPAMQKSQLYRTARVVAILYQLSETLGDDALAVNISERALRAIPTGSKGANDVDLMEHIQARVEGGEEDVQAVVDEEIAAAQEKFAKKKSGGDAEFDDPESEETAAQADRMGAGTTGGAATFESVEGQGGTLSDGGPSASADEIAMVGRLGNLRRGLQLLAGVGADAEDLVGQMSRSEVDDLQAMTAAARAAIEAISGAGADDDDDVLEIDL